MNDQLATTRGSLPGSISQVVTVAKYNFLNYFRARRFFILLIITLLISGLLTFFVAYYRATFLPSAPLEFYMNWWGLAGSVIIIFSAIFFGGDAISGEFQDKTGYFLVPNPIRRSSIYVGKYISAFLASGIILGIFGAIAVMNGLYYYGLNIPYQFGLSLTFGLFYLAAVLGFTFFFSSLFKSSSISILVTAVLMLIGFSIIDQLVTSFANIEPWFSIAYAGGIMGSVLMDPYPQHLISVGGGPRGFSLNAYVATIPEGLTILLAYFVVTAILGLILFERKEFN